MPHSTRTSFLRARTIFIHQWTFPFWSLWLRARIFLYFANGPFSIAKGALPIACGPFCSSGPFIHNMPPSFPHTWTVFIHQDPVEFPMQQTFRVHTSLSTSGSFRARIVLCYKKRTFVFILEDPGTTMIFDQYVRTFLPTSDADGPLPNGRGYFRLSGHFLLPCGLNPDARGPILFTLTLS